MIIVVANQKGSIGKITTAQALVTGLTGKDIKCEASISIPRAISQRSAAWRATMSRCSMR